MAERGAVALSALDLIAAERHRQQDAEGWTPEHDDAHQRGEMAVAAACYALTEQHRDLKHVVVEVAENGGRDLGAWRPRFWPWGATWWKPTPGDRVRELVKAGALIVAEIERLQRAEARDAGE